MEGNRAFSDLRGAYLDIWNNRPKKMEMWARDTICNRARLQNITERSEQLKIKDFGLEHPSLNKYAVSGQMIAQPLCLMESEVDSARVIKAGRRALKRIKDNINDESQPSAEHYLAACRPGFLYYSPEELSVDHGHLCSSCPRNGRDLIELIKEDWEASLSVAWDHLVSSDVGRVSLIYEFQESQTDELKQSIEALTYIGNVTDHSYQDAADIAVDYYSNVGHLRANKRA